VGGCGAREQPLKQPERAAGAGAARTQLSLCDGCEWTPQELYHCRERGHALKGAVHAHSDTVAVTAIGVTAESDAFAARALAGALQACGVGGLHSGELIQRTLHERAPARGFFSRRGAL
jgi:hypothetical protein